MSVLAANQQQLIAFALLSSSGVEVTGLGSTYNLSLSKNGAAFASGTGTKAEVGSGWYSYQLTTEETDTPGPLAIVVTGTGADQLNLLYEIRPYAAQEPTGTNILTAAEAAQVLRCETTDDLMLALLPSVDGYIKTATGHDWASDDPIHNTAKAAARILISLWYDNPAVIGDGGSLPAGLRACLTQLEALALRYRTFEGLSAAGLIYLPGVQKGDTVSQLIGIVGATGDQISKFENVISKNDYIEQTSSDNLEDRHYRVLITPLEAL